MPVVKLFSRVGSVATPLGPISVASPSPSPLANDHVQKSCTYTYRRFSVAAGTDHGIAGYAKPHGHEVRVRGCEIPHAEPCTEAALVAGSLQPQHPSDARGRPFALPDASLRSRKFSTTERVVHRRPNVQGHSLRCHLRTRAISEHLLLYNIESDS